MIILVPLMLLESQTLSTYYSLAKTGLHVCEILLYNLLNKIHNHIITVCILTACVMGYYSLKYMYIAVSLYCRFLLP